MRQHEKEREKEREKQKEKVWIEDETQNTKSSPLKSFWDCPTYDIAK